ncbi:hypothetical protein C8Q74DRAFT_1449937 [Fomes fomentarius]|nr:hypothetical protein C8Q74DRAFT_1449937 [Fomes fomentarius]
MWKAESIKNTLNLGRDDTLQWDWDLSSKANWKVPNPSPKDKYGYQLFYDKWRNEPFPTPDEFPHQVDLGSGEAGALLPFRRTATVSGTILVRKSYSDLYNRILIYRRDSGGVIITGQPGVGKSMFLKYMLARLLSEKQVVVFYTISGIHLFYQGAVYYHSETPDAMEAINNLPYHTQSTFSPWMLVDMDLEVREPRIDDVPSVWPILASSPNRKRWQCWAKQLDGVMWGMDVWTKEELMCGLRLHPIYERFVAELKTAWPPKQEQTQVNASPPVHRAVNFLESVKNAIAARAATGDEEDYSIMADATPLSVDTVDGALETLVDHAIIEIGHAPRDVYKAVFSWRDSTKNGLPNLSFETLCGVVTSFHNSRSLNDDRVIAVRPRSDQGPDDDGWEVVFVSDRVAYQIMECVKFEDQQEIQTGYKHYAMWPESSRFAGWIFELYAHRFLSGEFNGVLPGRLLMATDDCDPPCFTFDPLGHDLPAPTGALLRRERIIVDLSQSLEGVVLPGTRYYQPRAHNPLFDSFIIKYDEQQNSAVITFFQMTKESHHTSAKDGYPIIRNIMKHVRALFEVKVKVNVTVEYVLVCPSPVQKRTWQMPVGWNTSTTVQDHRGEAYCLHLSV